jgi:hypothetical protein
MSRIRRHPDSGKLFLFTEDEEEQRGSEICLLDIIPLFTIPFPQIIENIFSVSASKQNCSVS